jgi:hypothetical protein
MYNTIRSAHGGLCKYDILSRSHLLHKYASKFSHKIIPFKKDSGEAIAPPRLFQNRHGAEHSGHAGKLMY